jgi:hypothetical protein
VSEVHRNLKSENSQDNAHRNLNETVRSCIWLRDLLTPFQLASKKAVIHWLIQGFSQEVWRGGFTLRTAYLDMALILANASLLDLVYLEKNV